MTAQNKKLLTKNLGPSLKFNFGFTLIELLVVISIIGILSALAVASFSGAQARARDGQRKSDLSAIKKALELAKNDSIGGYFPNSFVSLTSIYIKVIPKDPKTGTSYTYNPAGCNGTWPNGGCTSYDMYAYFENSNDPSIAESLSKCGFSSGVAYHVCSD
ncbi:MAG: prepilin-type N-terminal cleavage/methylation domain-containing protein [Candidatus Curtissbacteria bacterium]